MKKIEKILVKSQFIQVVKDRDKSIIRHSLFSNPKIVSEDTMTLLDIFSNPRSLYSVLNEYDVGENGEKAIQDLIANYYLISHDFNERKFLAKRFAATVCV